MNTETTETPTPRTDQFKLGYATVVPKEGVKITHHNNTQWSDFARQLERELHEANEALMGYAKQDATALRMHGEDQAAILKLQQDLATARGEVERVRAKEVMLRRGLEDAAHALNTGGMRCADYYDHILSGPTPAMVPVSDLEEVKRELTERLQDRTQCHLAATQRDVQEMQRLRVQNDALKQERDEARGALQFLEKVATINGTVVISRPPNEGRWAIGDLLRMHSFGATFFEALQAALSHAGKGGVEQP